MSDTCPSCNVENTLTHAFHAGHQLCSQCGYVTEEVDLHSSHDLASGQGCSTNFSGRVPSHLRSGPVSREQSRKLESYRRKPEVVARIKLALRRVERPHLFEQVNHLFDCARSESWRRADTIDQNVDQDHGKFAPIESGSQGHRSMQLNRPVQWGEPSFSLAAACCFAVLRREGNLIDVSTVARASDLPVLRVKIAVRRLIRLVGFPADVVQLSNPDAFIQRFLGFFFEHAKTKMHSSLRKFLQPLLTKRVVVGSIFEQLERTALDLCSFWWPRRPMLACDPSLAAFALVVISLEAHAKVAAPRHQMFLLFPQAAGCESLGEESENGSKSPNARSLQALWDRYHEILSALDQVAQQFPWLMSGANSGSGSVAAGRKQGKANTTDRHKTRVMHFPHQELLTNLVDFLQMCKSLGPETAPLQRSGTICAREADNLSKADSVRAQWTSPIALLDHSLQAARKRLSGPCGETPTDGQSYPHLQARIEAAAGSDRNTQAQLLHEERSNASDAAMHSLDLLSDDEIDALLFTPNELQSIFRTSKSERDAFLESKIAAGIWDHDISTPPESANSFLSSNHMLNAEPDQTQVENGRHSHAREHSPGLRKRKRIESVPSHAVKAAIVGELPLQDQQDESDWSDSEPWQGL